MTLYLKKASASAMKTLLAATLPGFVVETENGNDVLVFYTHKWAILWDVQVEKTPAVMSTLVNEDGQLYEITPAVMEAGFFANVMIHDRELSSAALHAADTDPASPSTGWA